jgi:soluble lytic murein transglycosylase-like protein
MDRKLAVLLLAALAAAPASAGKVEIHVREDGTRLMKNEPGAARARRLAHHFVPVPSRRTADLIERWAMAREIDPEVVRAVVQVESGYNPRALSRKGAMGLMQLMPDTAHDFEVADPWDPEQNIRAGTAYLKRLMDRFQDLELALAAYNAGPDAVDQYSGVPPYEETRNYVHAVFCLLRGGCEEGEEPEGRPVRIVRDPDNKIRLTTSGSGG